MTWIKKVCPICALISLAWISLLLFKLLGYNIKDELLTLLMGGSAVGITYTLGNRLSGDTRAWKLIAIPIALGGMYALANLAWLYFLLAALGYGVVWMFFGLNRSKSDIKNQLDKCC